MGQWKKVAWSDESCFYFRSGRWPGGWVVFLGEEMAAGCTMGRRQASGGSTMLWAMFCWETLGPLQRIRGVALAPKFPRMQLAGLTVSSAVVLKGS